MILEKIVNLIKSQASLVLMISSEEERAERLVATAARLPEGSYWIELNLRGINESNSQGEAGIFILSNPGGMELLALGAGISIVAVGVAIIVMRARPSP